MQSKENTGLPAYVRLEDSMLAVIMYTFHVARTQCETVPFNASFGFCKQRPKQQPPFS